jgi:hypothetical protein
MSYDDTYDIIYAKPKKDTKIFDDKGRIKLRRTKEYVPGSDVPSPINKFTLYQQIFLLSDLGRMFELYDQNNNPITIKNIIQSPYEITQSPSGGKKSKKHYFKKNKGTRRRRKYL